MSFVTFTKVLLHSAVQRCWEKLEVIYYFDTEPFLLINPLCINMVVLNGLSVFEQLCKHWHSILIILRLKYFVFVHPNLLCLVIKIKHQKIRLFAIFYFLQRLIIWACWLYSPAHLMNNPKMTRPWTLLVERFTTSSRGCLGWGW